MNRTTLWLTLISILGHKAVLLAVPGLQPECDPSCSAVTAYMGNLLDIWGAFIAALVGVCAGALNAVSHQNSTRLFVWTVGLVCGAASVIYYPSSLLGSIDALLGIDGPENSLLVIVRWVLLPALMALFYISGALAYGVCAGIMRRAKWASPQ